MQLSKEKPAVLPVLELPRLAMLRDERFLVGAHVITAFAALSIGALMGPFQAFHRAPAFVEAFPDATIPVFSYYYQALTAHGTLNALFFTFIFISGFSYFMVGRSLKRKLWSLPLAWVGFGAMLVGLLMMLFVLITDPQRSAVLYTFYPPLIAPPTFYLGLVLLVLGCWITAANVIVTANLWRKEHPGERLPLAVFAAVANHWMFIVSSIGVAVEVVFLLLPASLGIIDRTDPQLSRVLFWFFGHPLVYYWLVPAYISIYTVLPQQAGGKLFSDPLARVAFLMLMILSLPTGVHHLFADPGVSEVNKAIHTFFTLLVSIPSFMTAFNIGATLERAGRARGGKGLFGWMFTQKWTDPSVAAQLVALILFISGGVSGLINASAQLNITVHNTSWVPGHFHQTVGGIVALTYIGIAYWLIPMIRGRALFSKKMALAQVYTWGLGMMLFGHTMAEAGLAGVPRRSLTGISPFLDEAMKYWLNGAAISGVILLISVILLFTNLVLTLVGSPKPLADVPEIQTTGDPRSPMVLERWGLWVGILAVLTIVAWAPVLAEAISATEGFQILRFLPTGVPLK
ncbi:MAG: cbb3-type cytochrome c oxidase subunit I [Thermoflexales bacterium]|nr:cbb3-type cytochrome c oxidase subunit I [Thermoflexales bacterium]